MSFSDLQFDQLSRSLRAGEYNVLLGAAASLGSLNRFAKAVPLSDDLRLSLCNLKGAKPSTSLQRVYGTLSRDDIESHIVRAFEGCQPGQTLRSLTKFMWRRIFTLNVDDALEAAYDDEDTYQELAVYNYKDVYEEVRDPTIVPAVHLHGWVKRADEGFVFSRSAYVQMMKSQNPWMVVLTQALAAEPFIILGSSLDEVDLDYYLSARSTSSYRTDRGPSILVEPYGDSVTEADCAKYGLTLFPGTGDEFMAFLKEKVLDRPRPAELIGDQGRRIFPTGVDPVSMSRFFADFEAVPISAPSNSSDHRFYQGHPPSWSDLASELDVSRSVSARISKAVDEIISGKDRTRKIVYLSDYAGGGKTTILDRVAFDYSRRGTKVLLCSALSRFEPKLSASLIDLIDGPCLVVVDDVVDQIFPVVDVVNMIEKDDVAFLIADRVYRQKHITRCLGSMPFEGIYGEDLTPDEIKRLIDNYSHVGMIGAKDAARRSEAFIKNLKRDPIAVACCRIMNDLRPLDRIIRDSRKDSSEGDYLRYLVAAVAHECFAGGIRFEVLVSASEGNGLEAQLSADHPFPLSFYDETVRNFVIPLNSGISRRIIELEIEEGGDTLLDVFVRIAKSLAPRVTIQAIIRRSPEARLAGRLLDYDNIVQKFLGDRAELLYGEIQKEWQWNSRYWEQRGLLRLAKFLSNPASVEASDELRLAVAHARQAVSIERHPLTLTTLAKILFAEMKAYRSSAANIFPEAQASSLEAIQIETRRARSSIQPYIVLFKGTREYLDLGGHLTERQSQSLEEALEDARRKFGRNPEITDLIDELTVT